MNEKCFLFDLDSTLTKEEILPKISVMVGKKEEMQFLTEKTMMGEIPFEESFRKRVEILKGIPVTMVSEMISNISLNEALVEFLKQNKEKCFVVTNNLDVWISELMERIGMSGHVFSSKASVINDEIVSIDRILNKEQIVQSMRMQTIAVGDGSNDASMIDAADIGIGFGGVRPVASAVLDVADYVIYDERKLIELLNKINKGGVKQYAG